MWALANLKYFLDGGECALGFVDMGINPAILELPFLGVSDKEGPFSVLVQHLVNAVGRRRLNMTPPEEAGRKRFEIGPG